MMQSGAPSQGGLLTALGAHLELLGGLLRKAEASGGKVPESSVVSMFKNASACIADDPSAKKLAGREGRKKSKGLSMRTPPPSASAGASAVSGASSDGQFLEAAISGGEEEMLSILERRADPNRVFSNFKVGPRTFVEGTALSIAAQRGQLEVVSALLGHGARPDATYSLTVGAEHTTERFPVGFQTVWDANTELLEMLLDARADLHSMTSSLNASMLWEAAYLGRETMARYVLDRGIDIEAAATSQDNRSWKFTALHAACYKGEAAVVALLLQRGADVEGRNAGGRTPLADAIIKGHGDIVRMLIAARGDLFNVACNTASASSLAKKGSGRFGVDFMMPHWGEEDNTPGQVTPIKMLFREANDHVIAEAAKGLQIAPRPIDTQTFIKFLSAKGDAPVEIMRAVAQPQELWYWNEKMERAHVQTALMKPNSEYIVGYGPHSRRLKGTFDRKERPTPEVEAFIRNIAPESRILKRKRLGSRRVRGRLMMCDVPRIFFNPQVLQAMMNCEMREFFEMQSVQAVINVHWRQVKNTANFQIVFQVLYCTTGMGLNILLLEFEKEPWRPIALASAVWVCFFFWLVEVALEFCEMIGFFHARLFYTVYCNRFRAVDCTRLCASGGVLAYAIVRKADAKQAVWFNCAFGLMMLLRWMRVLYSFRGIKFFGVYLLPITTCLSHVFPFCAVLFPLVLGFGNMYYAFGLHSPVDSLVIILRLILQGETDLDEFEGVTQSWSPAEGGGATYVAEIPSTEYYVIVRVFLVVCAMVMGTAMMNIFIAVLSEEYHEAYTRRYGMFFRSRAQLAIREYITWRGLRRAIDLMRRRPPGPAAMDDEEDVGGNFVWYFRREEETLEGAGFSLPGAG